jgi:hypothetical protein
MDCKGLRFLNWRAFVLVYTALYLIVMFKFNLIFHDIAYPYDVPAELSGQRLGEAESAGHYFLRSVGIIGTSGRYGPADLTRVLPMMVVTAAVLLLVQYVLWITARCISGRVSRGRLRQG